MKYKLKIEKMPLGLELVCYTMAGAYLFFGLPILKNNLDFIGIYLVAPLCWIIAVNLTKIKIVSKEKHQ